MKNTVRNILLILFYVAIAQCVNYTIVKNDVVPMWPSAGFAFAAIATWGFQMCWGVFIGSFLSSTLILISKSHFSLMGVFFTGCSAVGDTLEAMLAFFLFRLVTNSNDIFSKSKNIVVFILAAAIGVTVSSVIGATCISMQINVPWFILMKSWWIGAFIGIIVFSPLLLSWKNSTSLSENITYGKSIEISIIVFSTLFITYISFHFKNYPLEYTIIPLLLWAAFRLPLQFVTSLIVLISIIAVLGTVKGYGTFSIYAYNTALLLLQSFIGVIAISTYILFTTVTELKQSRDNLEQEVQKRTKELKANQDLFCFFMDHLPCIAYMKDLEGRYIFINKQLQKLFRLQNNDEWNGKTDKEINFFSFSIIEKIVAGDKKVLKTGNTSETIEDISIDNNIHHLLTIKFSVKDIQGNIIGIGGAAVDITDRKKAEEAIKDERNKAQLYLEIAGVIIIALNKHGEITLINKKGCEILGYPVEELIGKNWFTNFLPKDNQEDRIKHFQNFLAGDIEFLKHYETYIQTKDGEHLISWFNTPLYDDDGKIIGSLSSGEDITERKHIKKELQKMQRLKSIGTLAGGIAHDFNNILMGLFGYISLAKTLMAPDHPSFGSLDEAEKSMDRATRLTSQLLTFAKGGVLSKENVNIGEIIREIANFDLSGSNVMLVFRQEENLSIAKADKGQLQQVFSNLIINANEAMPNGGHLHVSLKNINILKNSLTSLTPGKYIEIIVQDEGVGIDQKYLDQIFDPYFSTKKIGSGLGLATAYSIIKKHRGHIEVSSEAGKGTTFSIYLPACQTDNLPKSQKSIVNHLEIKQNTRILVMDDDQVIRVLLKEMLERIGFCVETTVDGKEAIEIYKQYLNTKESFDVIIMDLTIPGGMGGKDAIKEILKIDPTTVAVVSSGYTDNLVIADHTKYGFKGVITKPYTIKELKRVLTNVLV